MTKSRKELAVRNTRELVNSVFDGRTEEKLIDAIKRIADVIGIPVNIITEKKLGNMIVKGINLLEEYYSVRVPDAMLLYFDKECTRLAHIVVNEDIYIMKDAALGSLLHIRKVLLDEYERLMLIQFNSRMYEEYLEENPQC